ncbi:unnamed protein product, partial [Urochloa humidicola]
ALLPFLPCSASSPPLPSRPWIGTSTSVGAGGCRAGRGGAGRVIRKQPLPIPSPPRPGMRDSQAAAAVARSSKRWRDASFLERSAARIHPLHHVASPGLAAHVAQIWVGRVRPPSASPRNGTSAPGLATPRDAGQLYPRA